MTDAVSESSFTQWREPFTSCGTILADLSARIQSMFSALIHRIGVPKKESKKPGGMARALVPTLYTLVDPRLYLQRWSLICRCNRYHNRYASSFLAITEAVSNAAQTHDGMVVPSTKTSLMTMAEDLNKMEKEMAWIEGCAIMAAQFAENWPINAGQFRRLAAALQEFLDTQGEIESLSKRVSIALTNTGAG